MYSEGIKVLGAILKDDGEIVVAAYSGIPKGHTIEASFMKGTLKARIDEIKKQKDNGDDLLTSADAAMAYAPSDIKRVFWSKDTAMGNNLMVEMAKVNLKDGQNIKINDKTYSFVRNTMWRSYGVHFVIVKPIDEVEEVVKEQENTNKSVS